MDHLFPYQDDTSYLVGDTAVEYLLSLPPTVSHKNACIINIMAVRLIAKTKVKHGFTRVLTNKLYFGTVLYSQIQLNSISQPLSHSVKFVILIPPSQPVEEIMS